MFIEISLISCGVYFGSKLYKKIQGKIQKESDPLKNSLQSQASQAVTNSLPIKNSYTDYEKTINRNMIISAGSIVLTIAGSLFYSPLTLFGCAGVIYVILPIIKRAKDAVFKERRMRIAILDSLAIISALAFGYYVICAFASCIYYIAQKLLLKTEDKAKQSLVNIFGEQPASVWISKNDMEIEIPFEALSAGDITVAGAGEQIPADGVIIGGNASIDQHILTGEAQPVEKGVGDQVFSSTIILSGKIHIQVEKTGQETVAAKIVNVLNKTDDFKSFVQLQGEEIADKSVVPVLAASAFAYPLVGTYGTIALLASDFLDNMRIVAPIGMLNTLLAASQTGLLIKDGRSLELLNQIDTFVFDKTGTLTLEQPSVHNIFSFSEIKEDKIEDKFYVQMLNELDKKNGP